MLVALDTKTYSKEVVEEHLAELEELANVLRQHPFTQLRAVGITAEATNHGHLRPQASRRHGLSRELPALDTSGFRPPPGPGPVDERQLSLF